jgi:hypothetical protein
MHMNDYSKITALYSRLSVGDEDRDGGESNSIQNQYSIMYKSACDAAKEKGGNLFISEISPPEEFYCIIEKDDVPAGYLGIKDTSTDLWEIAIELDAKHTRHGLGPQSIRLYLNEIQRITGKGEFKAVVEVDNLPSQKCFERLSAKLVGLCGSVVLKTDEEKRQITWKAGEMPCKLRPYPL